MIMGKIQQGSCKMSSSEQERQGRREERGGWKTHWMFTRQVRGDARTGKVVLNQTAERQRQSTYRDNHQPASDLSSITTVVCRQWDPVHTEARTPGCRLHV